METTAYSNLVFSGNVNRNQVAKFSMQSLQIVYENNTFKLKKKVIENNLWHYSIKYSKINSSKPKRDI